MNQKEIPEKSYEKINSSIDKLEEVRYSLDDLSSSLYNVGNKNLGEKLIKLSLTLKLVIGYLKLSESQIVEEGYSQAVQNTSNVVNSALAGIKISTNEE